MTFKVAGSTTGYTYEKDANGKITEYKDSSGNVIDRTVFEQAEGVKLNGNGDGFIKTASSEPQAESPAAQGYTQIPGTNFYYKESATPAIVDAQGNDATTEFAAWYKTQQGESEESVSQTNSETSTEKIGVLDRIKAFGSGIVNSVANMFTEKDPETGERSFSLKQTLKTIATAAAVAAAAALLVAAEVVTAGQVTWLIVGAGVVMGGAKVVEAAVAGTQEGLTDEQILQNWETAGEGVGEIGMAIATKRVIKSGMTNVQTASTTARMAARANGSGKVSAWAQGVGAGMKTIIPNKQTVKDAGNAVKKGTETAYDAVRHPQKTYRSYKANRTKANAEVQQSKSAVENAQTHEDIAAARRNVESNQHLSAKQKQKLLDQLNDKAQSSTTKHTDIKGLKKNADSMQGQRGAKKAAEEYRHEVRRSTDREALEEIRSDGTGKYKDYDNAKFKAEIEKAKPGESAENDALYSAIEKSNNLTSSQKSALRAELKAKGAVQSLNSRTVNARIRTLDKQIKTQMETEMNGVFERSSIRKKGRINEEKYNEVKTKIESEVKNPADKANLLKKLESRKKLVEKLNSSDKITVTEYQKMVKDFSRSTNNGKVTRPGDEVALKALEKKIISDKSLTKTDRAALLKEIYKQQHSINPEKYPDIEPWLEAIKAKQAAKTEKAQAKADKAKAAKEEGDASSAERTARNQQRRKVKKARKTNKNSTKNEKKISENTAEQERLAAENERLQAEKETAANAAKDAEARRSAAERNEQNAIQRRKQLESDKKAAQNGVKQAKKELVAAEKAAKQYKTKDRDVRISELENQINTKTANGEDVSSLQAEFDALKRVQTAETNLAAAKSKVEKINGYINNCNQKVSDYNGAKKAAGKEQSAQETAARKAQKEIDKNNQKSGKLSEENEKLAAKNRTNETARNEALEEAEQAGKAKRKSRSEKEKAKADKEEAKGREKTAEEKISEANGKLAPEKDMHPYLGGIIGAQALGSAEDLIGTTPAASTPVVPTSGDDEEEPAAPEEPGAGEEKIPGEEEVPATDSVNPEEGGEDGSGTPTTPPCGNGEAPGSVPSDETPATPPDGGSETVTEPQNPREPQKLQGSQTPEPSRPANPGDDDEDNTFSLNNKYITGLDENGNKTDISPAERLILTQQIENASTLEDVALIYSELRTFNKFNGRKQLLSTLKRKRKLIEAKTASSEAESGTKASEKAQSKAEKAESRYNTKFGKLQSNNTELDISENNQVDLYDLDGAYTVDTTHGTIFNHSDVQLVDSDGNAAVLDGSGQNAETVTVGFDENRISVTPSNDVAANSAPEGSEQSAEGSSQSPQPPADSEHMQKNTTDNDYDDYYADDDTETHYLGGGMA